MAYDRNEKAHRYPITIAQFEQLLADKLISWGTVTELPYDATFPGQIRVGDTVGVMVSGSVSNPWLLEDALAVAGIDLLVHETKQRAKEPEGNAYHYRVLKVVDDEHPYVIEGPYRGAGADIGHWFAIDDVDIYFR